MKDWDFALVGACGVIGFAGGMIGFAVIEGLDDVSSNILLGAALAAITGLIGGGVGGFATVKLQEGSERREHERQKMGAMNAITAELILIVANAITLREDFENCDTQEEYQSACSSLQRQCNAMRSALVTSTEQISRYFPEEAMRVVVDRSMLEYAIRALEEAAERVVSLSEEQLNRFWEDERVRTQRIESKLIVIDRVIAQTRAIAEAVTDPEYDFAGAVENNLARAREAR